MADTEGYTPERTVEPTYPQYTNLGLGKGTFDQLMEAVKHHLDTQFNLNRITGPQYAEVYIASLQAAMQASTQYLMGILFADQQRDKIVAETSLITKQEEKVDAEIRLVDLEEDKFRYEMEHILPLRKQELEATIANLTKQGQLIDKQIEKIDADMDHLDAQESLWAKQELKIQAEIDNLVKQGQLIDQQILKMQAEVLLMNAKVVTERANTEAGVADSNSLIGKQLSLLTAQKYAFAGDIRVKCAKMEADYANVIMTVLEPPGQTSLIGEIKSIYGKAETVAGQIESA